MASIAIEGLTKRYEAAGRRAAGGEKPGAALAGLDLDVHDGELVVVVGPSGCGKSTLLRLVAGLETPDAGTVRLDGRDLSGVSPQARDVAMVFQGYALYPHLSVRANIEFPLKMRRVGRSERGERVREAAALVGLEALLDRSPSELSGGERQRVAMARAIVRSPKAFLFDEPLANLDAKLRAELRVELAALVRRLGATAVYVTHDQVEAMTMADRVVVLERGVLQQLGPPRAIYESPANVFVAGFLGTPAMNLVACEREGAELVAPGLRLRPPVLHDDDARASDGPVTLGIRPEALSLGAPRAGELGLRLAAKAVEPLGAETYAYLETRPADGDEAAGAATTLLRARLPGFVDLAPGADVEARFALSAAHWFDTATGKRLRPATPAASDAPEAAADTPEAAADAPEAAADAPEAAACAEDPERA